MDRIKVPYVNIRPSRLTYYERYLFRDCRRSYVQVINQNNLKNNKRNEEISRKARIRIKDGIDWLLYVSNPKSVYNKKTNSSFRYRIAFITLTLSSLQVHNDVDIKHRLLNNFLVQARAKWKVKHYLWRAEAQNNGNIHFHIIVDQFIPWRELRDTWNKVQNNLGYVDAYAIKHKNVPFNEYYQNNPPTKKRTLTQIKQAYRNGLESNWHDPNSTDIHSIRKIKNISNYIASYCTKKSENRAIDGQLWGLSHSLSKLKAASCELFDNVKEDLFNIFQKFEKKIIYCEYATILNVSIKEWSNLAPLHLYNVLQKYLNNFSPG